MIRKITAGIPNRATSNPVTIVSFIAISRFPVKAIALLALIYLALAQQPPQPVTRGFLELDRYRASQLATYANDYGELACYRSANAAIKPPVPGESRVVFFGDSITELWKLDDSFPGKRYINRGISGQTTSQMLLRFRQDVIDLQPKAVIILAGTNDIAGNTGRISNDDIEANLTSMAELAREHNIRVIFSSILPVNNYTPESQELYASRPPDRILTVNRWMQDYCTANKLVYLDYFSAMIDEKALLKRNLAQDGLHPNKAGYAIMAPLADSAIKASLRRSALSTHR